jgi:2-polyprenyl-3-methyl-5-hydroxy-6-metoxy-1,4-benzoquinol methylase
MTKVFGDLFYEGFESLQRHSDEKRVYVEKFVEYIGRYAASSLLDVGAGDGEVALPISEHVDNYVAIEQSLEYAMRLQAAGKTVVNQLFPTDIKGKYDLVVMSHVISHVSGNYTTLVPAAWDLINPDGHLLVVTHRGAKEDDWSRLLESVGLGYSETSSKHLSELIDDLSERGDTTIENVVTHLKADQSSQMIRAMAFLAASGGKTHYNRFMEKADAVTEVLESRYRVEDGFYFPFIHPFISTKKPSV